MSDKPAELSTKQAVGIAYAGLGAVLGIAAGAITFFARGGLSGERTVSYWAACDRAWSRRRPEEYPDFEDWRCAATSYVER